MKIIGVGCGPGMLTEQAIREIGNAKFVFGSERAIGLARPYIKNDCVVKSIENYRNLSILPNESVILSTGDPMLAGLGYLKGDVVPGISSLQVAAAHLRLPLARISVVVAHGRGHEKAMQETLEEVRHGKVVFLLADPKFDVKELYRRLSSMGLEIPVKIAVCEELGYPNERIATGDLVLPPLPESDLYSLVIGNF